MNTMLLPERSTSESENDITSFREDLRYAIQNKRLEVHYQPKVDLRDGSNGHFEALVRWNDSKMGFVSPAAFIPIAEEMGLIDEVTKIVIDRVVFDLCSWRQSGVPVKSVAINISARHFSNEERAKTLMSWLTQESFPTEFITLELTETAMLCHPDIARKYLHMLHYIGFRIALDDFGTGYSSVTHLLDFPISEIKIDRSFVTDICQSFKCQAIVRALSGLAKALSIDIVAEGIEHLDALAVLQTLGCSFGQGYIFAKPLPEAQVLEYLLRQTSSSAILSNVAAL